MEIVYYPNEQAVRMAMVQDEPILAAIAFDGQSAYVSSADDSMEHHILLMNVGRESHEVDCYFRIVFDREDADWTFSCPPNYKNITFKDKRIERFYKDGYAVIKEFLHTVGYAVEIQIPKRYACHLNMMGDSATL